MSIHVSQRSSVDVLDYTHIDVRSRGVLRTAEHRERGKVRRADDRPVAFIIIIIVIIIVVVVVVIIVAVVAYKLIWLALRPTRFETARPYASRCSWAPGTQALVGREIARYEHVSLDCTVCVREFCK